MQSCIRRGTCVFGSTLTFQSAECVLLQQRRHHLRQTPPSNSEDRVTSWCRRLWGLTQSHGGESSPLSLPLSTLSSSDHTQGLLNEVVNQMKLAEELKAVLVGEKGCLPGSVVESVWSVYESIISPDMLTDIARLGTPAQETKFFEFMGLLTELDINLVDLKVAAEKLTQSINTVEVLLSDVQHSEGKGAGRQDNDTGSDRCPNNVATLSSRLAVAKNDLLRQCIAVRQAGSPVYYLWLRQSVSLERGMRRLMGLRRCLTYFKGKCRERINAFHIQEQQEQQEKQSLLPDEKEMVRMREEINLWVTRQRHVSAIDGALEFLFSDFFAKEWLVMEELTWYSTPPSLLEQVMAAERVHPFSGGLTDMKRRLQPTRGRHLFAFFHPAVVDEPLIAVQVALTRGIACSVDHILDRPSPLNKQERKEKVCGGCSDTTGNNNNDDGVDTAIFYSINSAQSALRGINLGNLLIKRVVHEIEARLNVERRASGLTPITTFSTLSPIPGYIPWLVVEVAKLRRHVFHHGGDCHSPEGLKFAQHRIFGDISNDDERCFFSQLRAAVLDFAQRHPYIYMDLATELHSQFALDVKDAANFFSMQFLLRLFQGPNDKDNKNHHFLWWEDNIFTRAIEGPLLRSVAHYLYKEKRRSPILDPVGNFHVSNGAAMWRLNYLANCTATGSRESATVMVNYLYDPTRVREQVNAYEMHRTVSVGSDILHHLGIG